MYYSIYIRPFLLMLSCLCCYVNEKASQQLCEGEGGDPVSDCPLVWRESLVGVTF